MQVFKSSLQDCVRIVPTVFRDERGSFFESFHEEKFSEHVLKKLKFVQDNISVSRAGVIRGLHYQYQRPQGKLVSAIRGSILDVAIDLRSGSATYGQHFSCILSDENREQLWVPPGFAHGFLALEDSTTVMYKVTDFYNPGDEHCICWDDKTLMVDWRLETDFKGKFGQVLLSAKDRSGKAFEDAPKFK